MRYRIMVFTILVFMLSHNAGFCQTEPDAEKERQKALAHVRSVYEKMLRRTQDYYEKADDLLYKLNSLALHAQSNNDNSRTDELCLTLIDYNSFIKDLGVMKEILAMEEFIESEKFMDYFDSMARCYDALKRDFSLKNELFLSRLEMLKDEQVLYHEKELIGLYRDYFLYDLWHEQMKPEDNAGKEPEA
jgi:negative regulator of replication initiation